MIARGHATAMPSSVMNSRRRIGLPHANVRAYPALVNVALSDAESSGFRGERPVAIVGDPITRQAAGNSTDSASASWPSPVNLGSACPARSLHVGLVDDVLGRQLLGVLNSASLLSGSRHCCL